MSGQTEQVVVNLRVALQAAGADLTDVVKTTVYVATQRQEDLHAAWDVVSHHFGDHDALSTPARRERARLPRPARRG